jgi:hypothetical protein
MMRGLLRHDFGRRPVREHEESDRLHPSARASPKCWIETSASVQWVAIRATEAPTAVRALEVVHRRQAGQHQDGDLGPRGLVDRSGDQASSSTRLKP